MNFFLKDYLIRFKPLVLAHVGVPIVKSKILSISTGPVWSPTIGVLKTKF